MPVGAQPRRRGRLPRQRLRRRRLPRPQHARRRGRDALPLPAAARPLDAGCRRCRRARGALAAAVGRRIASTPSAAPRAAAARSPRSRVYDFRTRRWSAGPDLPLAREHLAAAAAGGRVYALAGRAAGQGNFARVDRYDPARRRWTRARDMGKPRGGIAAATVGGRIAVFGGEEGAGTIREVELYDPARDRWRAAARHAHAAPRARRRVRRPAHLRDRGRRRARASTSPASLEYLRSTSGRRSSTRYAFWFWPCWKEKPEQVAARERVDAARLGLRERLRARRLSAGSWRASGISSCGSRSPGRKNSASSASSSRRPPRPRRRSCPAS